MQPNSHTCRSVYVEEATPSYGEETLEAFFTKAVKEGLKWVPGAIYGWGNRAE